MANDPVVIVSAARTPMGSLQGSLSPMTAPKLGAVAIAAAIERAGIAPDAVQEVLMGCVLTGGLGQAPARQAALGAGLPKAVPCTTVGKVCGSGMKAIMQAYDAVMAGSADVVVAGGMESMTNAPYLLQKGRGGYRLGHSQVFDSMMLDGLEDAYEVGRSMGTFGEDCAAKYEFSRADQDAYAVETVQRAQKAIAEGLFKAEIAPVSVVDRKGETIVDTDEGPGKIKTDKIPQLKAAFKKDGTITAASSSSINDGAAAVVMMRESTANRLGLKPMARVLGHSMHAQEPSWFTTAPVSGMRKLIDRLSWSVADVDLFEINEAFAVVPMAAMRELEIPRDKVNVNGGACALGHPIGCSGARIVVTLLYALQTRGLKRGVASLCIGGGEATSLAIERV